MTRGCPSTEVDNILARYRCPRKKIAATREERSEKTDTSTIKMTGSKGAKGSRPRKTTATRRREKREEMRDPGRCVEFLPQRGRQRSPNGPPEGDLGPRASQSVLPNNTFAFPGESFARNEVRGVFPKDSLTLRPSRWLAVTA
ncbi:hypothetical protein N9L68_06635 [bacterium]|nr:hypothetical protein [bacterium]